MYQRALRFRYQSGEKARGLGQVQGPTPRRLKVLPSASQSWNMAFSSSLDQLVPSGFNTDHFSSMNLTTVLTNDDHICRYWMLSVRINPSEVNIDLFVVYSWQEHVFPSYFIRGLKSLHLKPGRVQYSARDLVKTLTRSFEHFEVSGGKCLSMEEWYRCLNFSVENFISQEFLRAPLWVWCRSD